MKKHFRSFAILAVAVLLPALPVKSLFASACDTPGECKGVTAEPSLPAPATPAPEPKSASGCFIPGKINCQMIAGNCQCEDPKTAPDDGYGFLCLVSEKCKIGVVTVVNGKKTCEVRPDPACSSDSSSVPVPAIPNDPTAAAVPIPAPSPATPPPAIPENPTATSDPLPPLNVPPSQPSPQGPASGPAPKPATPPLAFCENLPAEYRDCCEAWNGVPLDVMQFCIDDSERSKGCNIIVNVAGDVNQAQMNVCCQAVTNAGTIDADVSQTCENNYGPAAVPNVPQETPKSNTATVSEQESGPKNLDSAFIKGGGEGCTLSADAASPATPIPQAALAALASALLFVARFALRNDRTSKE